MTCKVANCIRDSINISSFGCYSPFERHPQCRIELAAQNHRHATIESAHLYVLHFDALHLQKWWQFVFEFVWFADGVYGTFAVCTYHLRWLQEINGQIKMKMVE